MNGLILNMQAKYGLFLSDCAISDPKAQFVILEREPQKFPTSASY